MDLDRAREFLRTNHRAVLATRRRDGAPQLSPVVVGVDDDGAATISTRETALKTKNLRREGRAWLCGINDGFFGEWIQAEGDVEIIEMPEALSGLRDLYRRIAGEHPNWEEYDEAMRTERRVLVRIHLDRAGPDASG